MIHARAVIGKNCMIGSCVTIGGRGKHYEVPVIGDNVQISTGSKILGPVHIGDNVVIGANSTVLKYTFKLCSCWFSSKNNQGKYKYQRLSISQ